ANDPATAAAVNIDLLLFPDGRIKFEYRTDVSMALATVGIEYAGGTDGIELLAAGTSLPGVALTAGEVIEFLPPPELAGACTTAPALTCGRTNGASPPPGPNALGYSCGAGTYSAQEMAYSITLTEPTRLDLTLTGPTALS